MNRRFSIRLLVWGILALLLSLPLAMTSAGDGNILWNELGHNSRDPLYRSPGGAVPTDTPITLRFRAADGDLDSATVRVWNDRIDVSTLYPMTRVTGGVTFPGDPATYEIWEATLPASALPTVYWYRFILTDGGTTVYYEDDAARNGGWGEPSSSSPDHSWQLTIYDPDFQTPDWVKNAVIYQIFPDRFRDGDPANNPSAGEFFYGNFDTVYRSNGTTADWNTHICDPRDSFDPGTCTGIWSQNFYGGDLQGIIDKLDYLQDLGVTALYLNPIFESPSNHKYDTTDFFHIDDNFGDLATFIELTEEADDRGINIILDGVFNHSSSDSIYFDRYDRWNQTSSAPTDPHPTPVAPGTSDVTGACESVSSDFADWYTFFDYTGPDTAPCSDNRDYPKWFGIFDSLPVLQHDDDEVRDYFINNGVNAVGPYWMQWADGWRLDVAPEVDHGTIVDPSDDYWEAFRTAVHAVNPDAYIVGEEWGNPTSWTIGGEWDATMNYQFSAAILSFWRDTYFQDNDFNPNSSAGPLDPLTPSELNARLLNLQERYAPEAFMAMMNLFGSHDTNRVLFLLDHNANNNNPALYNDPNYNWTDAISRLRGAALMQMTMPGAPTIYYGDEIGTVGPIGWDGSQWQDDPYNRQPYPWLDETGTPFYSHLQSTTERDALFNYYAALTNIRNITPALRTGSFDPLVVDDANNAYVYGRKMADDSSAAVVMINRQDVPQTISVDVSGYLPVGAVLTDALNGGTVTVNASGIISVNDVPARNGAILVLDSFNNRPVGVTDLSASSASGQVDLSWTATANTTSYNVYRSLFSGGGYTMIGNTASPSYSDTTVANATSYYYVVVPVNDTTLLEGPQSNEVSAIPTLQINWHALWWPQTLSYTLNATTPTDLVFGQVYIAGATDVIDGQAPGVTAEVGYGPENSDPTDPTWTWFPMSFNAESGNNDEYMGSLLPTSTGTFSYTVRWSTDGGSTWRYSQWRDPGGDYVSGNLGTLTVVGGSDSTAPPAPTNLTVSGASASSVSLAWDVHPNTDGDLFGFRIYREEVGGSGFSLVGSVNDATATTFTDTGVANGTEYNYYLTAVDTSLNESAPSNTVNVMAEMRLVDVTFRVTVPAGSPGSVYVAGSFGSFAGSPYPNWDPAGIVLTEVSPDVWEVTLQILDGTNLAYKFTRGDWERVEKGPNDEELGDRQLLVDYGTTGTQLAEHTVDNWRDPYVTAFSPADDATDVPNDTTITVTWNIEMPATLSGFSVTGPGGAVSGTLSYDDTTLTHTFTPDAPLAGGTHTVQISGSSDAAGDQQRVPTTFSFDVESQQAAHDLSQAWFNLQWPETTSTTVGTPTQDIYGQIYIGGATDASSEQVPGITAQVGYGPAADDPSSPSWHWFPMSFNTGSGPNNNDEYGGQITPTSAGTFAYTTRWSADGGSTWFYTDLDGPGYSADQAGNLTVNEVVPETVDVTFSVTVPAHTPGSVYLVGSFSAPHPAWDPGGMVMTETAPNVWEITLTLTEGANIEYKYTRGSWETVEKEADGNTDILSGGNRSLTVADSGSGTQTVTDTVDNWRDPYVTAFSPADGATDVPNDTTITVTWNIEMPATLSGFSVTGPGGAVSGTLSYDDTTLTHTFTPDAPLADGLYDVTISGNTDVAGDSQQVATSFSFTVAAPAPPLAITSFTLIDAATDTPVPGFDPIPVDAVLERFSLPDSLSIRANFGAEEPGSVVLYLNGELSRMENLAPFALFGDINGDYSGRTLPLGTHTVLAEPYSGGSGSGDMGQTLELTFTVVETTTPAPPVAVTSFTLVDADTDTPIPGFDPIPADAIIDLNVTPEVNIRANTTGDAISSVIFSLNGEQARTESRAPYYLAGDNNGDAYAWNAPLGTHTLTATPYVRTDSGNEAGTAFTLNFSVVMGTSSDPDDTAVTGFTLVEASGSYADIRALTDNDTITITDEAPVNITAQVTGAVDYVQFQVNGVDYWRESVVPYAIGGDNRGEYYPWQPGSGTFEITAIPYADGVAGTPLTITVEVSMD
ncbi:MAG: alpha-amylase family glycosyl hydrolase [Chloroflexota bacterium]